MEKDADAYRTISEVAETLDIPPHVLRFWETKFPQIKPLKRGGGRRYYRRCDTDLLRTIRRLLYDDGYTIRGVQRLLKTKGVAMVTASAPSDLPSPRELEEVEADVGSNADLPAASPDHERVHAAVASLTDEIASCRGILEAALAPVGRDRDGSATP